MKNMLILAAAMVTFMACGDKNTTNNSGTPTEAHTTTAGDHSTPAPAAGMTDADFKAKAVKADGTPITWENAEMGTFFFRADGTFGAQGLGGEEAMYDGKWKMEGGKLVLTSSQNGGPHEVKFDGGKFYMDGKEFTEAKF